MQYFISSCDIIKYGAAIKAVKALYPDTPNINDKNYRIEAEPCPERGGFMVKIIKVNG